MYTHIHPPRPYHPHRPPYMFPRGFCLLFSPWFSAITRFRRSTSAVAAIAVQCAKLGRDSAAVRELLQRELLQLAVYKNQQAASSHSGSLSLAAALFQRSSFTSSCTEDRFGERARVVLPIPPLLDVNEDAEDVLPEAPRCSRSSTSAPGGDRTAPRCPQPRVFLQGYWIRRSARDAPSQPVLPKAARTTRLDVHREVVAGGVLRQGLISTRVEGLDDFARGDLRCCSRSWLAAAAVFGGLRRTVS